MTDAPLFVTTIVAFAAGLTAHLTIAIALVSRRPRWRAPAALIIAPLALYFAVHERMWIRGGVWIAAAVVYAVARGLQ